jgi:hypothetical protein
MLRNQIKAFVEVIRLELASIHEQIGSAREGHERDSQSWREIPERLADLRTPEDDKRESRTYRDKAHRQQVILTWVTFFAFLAAAVYAGIAAQQLTQMRLATEATRESVQLASDSLHSTLLNLTGRCAKQLSRQSPSTSQHGRR